MPRVFLVLCCSLFLLLSTAAHAATIRYVHPTSGSNSNSCATSTSSTPGNAKATLTGSTGAFSCMAAGDTLRMHGGVYTESVYTDLANNGIPNGTGWSTATIIESYGGTVTWAYTGANAIWFRRGKIGTPDAYIILREAAGTTFIINGRLEGVFADQCDLGGPKCDFNLVFTDGTNHIKVDGLELTDSGKTCLSASVGNVSFLWFTHLNVHHCGGHGFYLSGTDGTVEYSLFANNDDTGGQLYDSNSSAIGADRYTVHHNIFRDNNKSGMSIDGDDNTIYNNIIEGNGVTGVGNGISVGYDPGSNNVKILNNTIHANASSGIQFGQSGSSTNLTVKNNSISNNTVCTSTSETTSGTADQNNCNSNTNNTFTMTGGTVTNTSTSTPGYVSAGTNFALDLGSGLIDSGTTTAPAPVICNGTCDIGAHETIGACTATMPDTAGDNTIVITCQNDRSPPLLPSTSCTGFSALKSDVAAPTTCTRTGNNQITLTLTSGSFTSGNTGKFTYSSSTGNVTDSALLGFLDNQRLNTISTPIQATNLISAGSVAVLTQVSGRFECFGGPENNPDCVKGINTGITVPLSACLRVRILLSCTVASCGSNGYSIYAQRNGTGGYTAIANGEPGANAVAFVTGSGKDPPELVAGPTTEYLSGAGTYVPGGVLLSASEIPNITLASGQDTELVGALCVSDLGVAGDYVDLRIYQAGGIALSAYTQTPRITIGEYTMQWGAR